MKARGHGDRSSSFLKVALAAFAMVALLGSHYFVQAGDARVAHASNAPKIHLISGPTGESTRDIGDVLDFLVVFDQRVTITGNPGLKLRVGDEMRQASYDEDYYDPASRRTFMSLSYTVQLGDYDTNGVQIPGGIVISGGSIVSHGGSQGADLSHNTIHYSNIKVNALPRLIERLKIISKPREGSVYRYGEHIEIRAKTNIPVVVQSGGTYLTVHVGDGDGSQTWRGAHYNRGSGSKELIFRYTVKATDIDDNGIRALWGNANYGLGGSGKIVAQSNENVELSRFYDGFSDQENHKIDGTPVLKYYHFWGEPESGDTYQQGETIQSTLYYDQPVDAVGDLELTLVLTDQPTDDTLSRTTRQMTYASGSGTKQLIFEYVVVSGDSADYRMGLTSGDNTGKISPVGTNVEFAVVFDDFSPPSHRRFYVFGGESEENRVGGL